MTSAVSLKEGAIVCRRDTGIDAIDEYSRRLLEAMRVDGVNARYHADGVSSTGGSLPAWVLLQYNPFGYGRNGFAPTLIREVRRLHRIGVPVALMVHEAWIDIVGAASAAIGLWQRAQLRALLQYADRVMTSTEALARELGNQAVHVPVGSNITPTSLLRVADAKQQLGLDDKLTLALFGRANPSRALDYAEVAIAAVARSLGPERVAVLNIGAGAPAIQVPVGVDVRQPGPLPAEEVSQHLAASDLVLLPFTDGMSTRRSTLMAALAHGRPVLGLSGPRTDAILDDDSAALVLTPLGDRNAYARTAAALAKDRGQLQQIGDSGHDLYRARFDWPVIARRVGSELDGIIRGRNRKVVFVAHDVGGSGGMERHSEQLVKRLLDAHTDVTVIARTCTLEPRPGLRFKRVRTPRRPFVFTYAAFFVVGSLLAWRERDGILHTTGAILANRADLSTVHYCHRAARERVAGSRASRPGRLYSLNQVVSGVMSRAAEDWCYRPSRTRLLCAVSGGVGEELRTAFPTMMAAVRTVPNGVDSSVFRPDAHAREALRAQLGLADDQPLALFVGGDWERKGLASAVTALAAAPGWRLAVAGKGHQEPMIALARKAGVEPRLQLLGSVQDMPRLYAAADAFVLPTSYEAFPLVALEAAASALPLLVTRVNGVDEMLDEGSNGWFITRRADDVARRLNELSANRELAESMAAAARLTAVAYSWDAMAERYVALYTELGLGRNSASSD
jgi:glycosyltransferase involved in cell wall biosynthesis